MLHQHKANAASKLKNGTQIAEPHPMMGAQEKSCEHVSFT